MLFHYNRILSSTMIWLLCYFAVFLLSPLSGFVENADTIAFIAFLGIVSFLFGIVFGKLFTQKRGLRLVKKVDDGYYKEPPFALLISVTTILLFLSLLLLLMRLGTGGIIAIFHGDISLSGLLGRSGRVRNIYSLVLRLLSTFSVFLLFSAKEKPEKRWAFLFILLSCLQTALFSYARGGIVYMVIMCAMYILRDKPTSTQVKYFFGVGFLCIVIMIFGGYLRSYGTKALGNIFQYYRDVEDWSSVLFGSLDFSAAYHWFSRLLENGNVWINPIVYLKPILMVVPRSIAPWKPEALSVQVLRQLSPTLAASGFSCGQSLLGEAKVILGNIGYLIYPFFWGIVCQMRDDLHFLRLNSGGYTGKQYLSYYYFATMIIIESQRGDLSAVLSTYLWTVAIPIWLVTKFSSMLVRKKKYEGSN